MIASFLVITIAVGLFVNVQLRAAPQGQTIGERIMDGISTSVKVEARDAAGHLKQTVVKENDLILSNFAYIVWGWLNHPVTSGGQVTWATGVKDTGGTTRSGSAKGGSPDFIEAWGVYAGSYRRTYGGVGSGGGSPAISDYTIGTPAFTNQLVTTPTTSGGNVTFSYVITATGSANVNEAGVMLVTGTQSTWTILLIHDTFTNIPVVATDTVTVTYTIVHGAGFTQNWINFMEDFFYPQVSYSDSDLTASLTDTSGGSRTVYTVAKSSGGNWFMDTASNYPNCVQIGIGTGTNAPALSDYELQTPVDSEAKTMAPIMQASINVTSAATITCGSARTVTEAGLYIWGYDTGGTARQFLYWRDTFTGVSIDAGRQISINFIIYFNI